MRETLLEAAATPHDESSRPADRASDPFRAVAFGLVLGVVACLGVVLGRVVQLQVWPSESLRANMEPRVSTRKEPPLRGDLLDRQNRVLAAARRGFRVVLDPTLTDETHLDAAIVRLAGVLGVSADELGTRIRTAQEVNRRRLAEAAEARRSISEVVPPAAVVVGADVPGAATQPQTHAIKKPIRYLPVSGIITESQALAVRDLAKELKISGVTVERQPVREYPGGEEIAAIVGKVGFGDLGLMGAEFLLEDQLSGEAGSIRYVRDARGRPLWMDPGSVRPAKSGDDVRLSIDLELQRMCHEELMQGVIDQNAQGGRLVLADPNTGEILAMVDIVRDVPGTIPFPWADVPPPRTKGDKTPPVKQTPIPTGKRFKIIPDDPMRRIHPSLARNRCIEDMYEPGSTFKPFVWSTINELGLAKLTETIDTEGGHWTLPIGRSLSDVVERDHQTWYEVLVNSSNIGMVKVASRMTPQQLHDACTRFGFGKPTGIGLPGRSVTGESAGAVTPVSKWTKFTHSSVPYGHEIAVTPVQMVRAFSAFAREGSMAGTLPRLRLDAADPGEGEGVIYRVLPPDVAIGVREPLSKVAGKMEETMKNALKMPPPEGGWRYRIFGKSGTADVPLGPAPKGKQRPRGSSGYYDDHFNSSFIAAGPLERPRLVVVVVIDDPRREGNRRLRYGTSAAGPVVRRVMERALTYLGAPPSPKVAPELRASN